MANRLPMSEETVRVLAQAGDSDARKILSNLGYMKRNEPECSVQVVYESHWDNIHMLVNGR